MATKKTSNKKPATKGKRTFNDKAREMSSEGIVIRRADGTVKHVSK